MSSGFPRIYSSFEEFERDELRRHDSMSSTVEGMLENRFSEELDFSGGGAEAPRRKRGRPRKNG